jgi:uncharacterized Fe-S cluster-containing radical SAM superfamily protein
LNLYKIGGWLSERKNFPFIEAVFYGKSLTMKDCTENDGISLPFFKCWLNYYDAWSRALQKFSTPEKIVAKKSEKVKKKKSEKV